MKQFNILVLVVNINNIDTTRHNKLKKQKTNKIKNKQTITKHIKTK
jgi:hypothetical protein